MPENRAIVYVDGLNLYGGICEVHRKDLLWIDLHKLIRWKISRDDDLIAIKYFNTTPKSDQDKIDRYLQWIDLLQNLSPKFEIIQGEFKKRPRRCKKCGQWYKDYEEKHTDVNIASHLLVDFFDDKFDIAYIISGDSDFVTALRIIRDRSIDKAIVGIFPPERYHDEIKKVCNRWEIIAIKELERFVLPDEFTLNGKEYVKPPKWTKCE